MRHATLTHSIKPSPSKLFASHEMEQISCGLLHDLINPINGLTLYLESLQNDTLKDFLIPIHKTSEHIRKYIEVLRDSFSVVKEQEKVNLHEVLSHITSLLGHKAIRNGVKIITVQRTPAITLTINRLTLYQILINIIGNALEAFDTIPQRKNKTVTVSTYSNRRGISIVITDNAAGIPELILKNLFTKTCTTKSTGCGVGLMNTNRLIQHDLGGTLQIKTSEGVGTKFHIILPRKYLS